MSTIDELIASFHAAGAERLLLVSGKAPVLTVNGDMRPMREADSRADDSIERHLLEGMVLIMGGEAELGQAEFTYGAPTGEVHVTTRVAERVFQIIIVPVGAANPSHSTPGDPYAAESDEEQAEPMTGFADSMDAGDSMLDEVTPLEGLQPGAQLPPHDSLEAVSPDAAADGLEDAFLTAPDEVEHFASNAAGDESSGSELPDLSSLLSDLDDSLSASPDTTDLDATATAQSGFEPGPATEFTPPQGFATPEAPDLDRLPELPGLPDPAETPEFTALPEFGDLVEAASTPVDQTESARLQPIDQIDDGSAPVFEARSDAPAMDRLFHKMVGKGCSDLHVSAGNVPLFRKDGRITDLGGEPKLSAGQVESLLMGITPDRFRKQFEERNDTDFAYEIEGVARFRCNLFRDRKGIGGVFRQIPADILSADQLGLNRGLLEMCQLKKGLILVTGPTGSGKSTTLAALIDHINTTRQDHIITIEDPIEFVHQNQKCLINQREVGEHTKSFKVALRAALREDPDIVLVGELRDLETVEIALETAETGHLVFGTLHTNTAAGTVSRLIDQFPAGQQAQIRTMLADTLQAVVAQTLCRKIKGGRVAALEILVATSAVANLIREDKTHQILSAMQTGGAQGMKTLNDALLELVQQKIVDPQEAYANAVDRADFRALLGRNGISFDGLEVAAAS